MKKIFLITILSILLILPIVSDANDETPHYYLSDGDLVYNQFQRSNFTSPNQVNSSVYPFELLLEFDSYEYELNTIQTTTISSNSGIITFDTLFENEFSMSTITQNGVEHHPEKYAMWYRDTGVSVSDNTSMTFGGQRSVNITTGTVHSANNSHGDYAPIFRPYFDEPDFNIIEMNYYLNTKRIHGVSQRTFQNEVFFPINRYSLVENGSVLGKGGWNVIGESSIGGLETWILIPDRQAKGEDSSITGIIRKLEWQIEKNTGLIMRIEGWVEYNEILSEGKFPDQEYHMEKILVGGFDNVQIQEQTEESPLPLHNFLFGYIPIHLVKSRTKKRLG